MASNRGFLASLKDWLRPRQDDGVALVSASHPASDVPTLPWDIDPATIEEAEIELPVYAAKGETVTCENGHPICDFACTVVIGMMQNQSAHFTNWRQREPMVGEAIPSCEVCGAAFYKHGGFFHIGNSWRMGFGRTGLRV